MLWLASDRSPALLINPARASSARARPRRVAGRGRPLAEALASVRSHLIALDCNAVPKAAWEALGSTTVPLPALAATR